MFQSVIDQQEWRARRLGTGAGVSLLVHAGVFAAVMVISAGVAKKVEPEERIVQILQAPPRGNPNPPAAKKVAAQPKPKPKPKPKTLVQPTAIPQQPPPEVDPSTAKPEETDPDDDLPYDPNGKLDGLEGATCVSCPALQNLPAAVLEPTGEEPSTYVYGTMTPPKLLSGAPLQYTREAREAHISGLLIAKCIITREGEVQKCHIIKGLPHMEEAAISALETRRYTPVTFQGKPISVSYIFNVKLAMPE